METSKGTRRKAERWTRPRIDVTRDGGETGRRTGECCLALPAARAGRVAGQWSRQGCCLVTSFTLWSEWAEQELTERRNRRSRGRSLPVMNAPVRNAALGAGETRPRLPGRLAHPQLQGPEPTRRRNGSCPHRLLRQCLPAASSGLPVPDRLEGAGRVRSAAPLVSYGFQQKRFL